MFNVRRWCVTCAVTLIVAVLFAPHGCAGVSRESESAVVAAPPKATPKSRTTVRFLTSEELNGYAALQGGTTDSDYPFIGTLVDPKVQAAVDAIKRDFSARVQSENQKYQTNPRVAALAIFAGFVIEQLIKFVIEKVKEEAETHQAQLAGVGSGRDIWNADRLRYRALEFRRDLYLDGTHIAVQQHLIYYIRRTSVEPNSCIFTMAPIFFMENDAVANTDSKRVLSATIDLAVEAVWNDAHGQPASKVVLPDAFLIKKYKAGLIVTEANKNDYKGKELGTLVEVGEARTRNDSLSYETVAFPVPSRWVDGPPALNARIKIAEVDQSTAAKFLRSIAGLAESGTDEVVSIVKDRVDRDLK